MSRKPSRRFQSGRLARLLVPLALALLLLGLAAALIITLAAVLGLTPGM
ncbi:MAG: hypothetical protein ACKOC5_13685 [Chloroflexota bacterium]